MLRLVDQAAADIAKFKQEREVNLSGEYEKYKQQRAAEMKAGRERLERERFAKVVAPIDAPNAANAAEAPTDAPGVLADSLLEAIAAARVPKGRLDLPVRSHADRLPSGRRGMSRAMLRAIRRFYGPRGALGKLMGDLIIEEGFEVSVCALTRSTGLSLIESLALTAEERGKDASALIGLATTFFSYSWMGTSLGDMLDAVERKLDELEATDGVTGTPTLSSPSTIWDRCCLTRASSTRRRRCSGRRSRRAVRRSVIGTVRLSSPSIIWGGCCMFGESSLTRRRCTGRRSR